MRGADSGEVGMCRRSRSTRSVLLAAQMPECRVMILVRPTCVWGQQISVGRCTFQRHLSSDLFKAYFRSW